MRVKGGCVAAPEKLGNSGEIIHTAAASNSTPAARFTHSIHGPAFGSTEWAVSASAISGTPMPSASTNSATPPNAASPVLAM